MILLRALFRSSPWRAIFSILSARLSDTVLFSSYKEDHGTGYFGERASFWCKTNLL
jgi:hypothetical protein